MYCTKCGAFVVGKYCSCCGQRVRSEMEEFRILERRRKKAFERSCEYSNGQIILHNARLADLCWITASLKYLKEPNAARWVEAEGSLDKVESAARYLFEKLKNF